MRFDAFDVFAGCGGLSLGLLKAGHKVVAACELDDWAAETYAANVPEVELFKCDIRNLDSSYLRSRFRGKINLVAAGPPCQGFSVSGKRQYGVLLDKNQLVYEFLRVVEAIQPESVLFENVRGFRTASITGHNAALPLLIQTLESRNYAVFHAVLDAADYGIPQYRRRLFLIATRLRLRDTPFPRPSHSGGTQPNLPQHLSVLDAISDLPRIGLTNDFHPYPTSSRNAYQRLLRRGTLGVFNHEAMKHSATLVQRFRQIPPGGKSYHLGRKGGQRGRVVTVYKSNNQRLIADLPSLCITANFQSTYIHPTLDRNLTAREAARIQSFPDWFVFHGKRTLMSSRLLAREGRHDENHLSQYNQIGNAVPPLLACRIAEHFAVALDGTLPARRGRRQVRLPQRTLL